MRGSSYLSQIRHGGELCRWFTGPISTQQCLEESQWTTADHLELISCCGYAPALQDAGVK